MELIDEIHFLSNRIEALKAVLQQIAHNLLDTCESPTSSCSENTLSFSCSTTGAQIHYTTDGSTPTAESPVGDTFTITDLLSVKVIATAMDHNPSEVMTENRQVKPVISCTNNVVTITHATGSTVHYTMDGSTPSEESTVYTGPITITATKTFKAFSVLSGYKDSFIAEATCTYVEPTE